MKAEDDNSALLIEYLLGGLSEEEQARVEREFFTSDEAYEKALALEDELRYDYAAGKLSASERERFEKRFLIRPEERQRVDLAKTVLVKAGEVSRSATAGTGWWQRVGRLFTAEWPAMRYVAATAMVLLAAMTVFVLFQVSRLEQQLAALQALPKPNPDLRQQLLAERARADRLSIELDRERVRGQQLDRKPDTNTSPHAASFLLTPFAVRDTRNANATRLLVSPNVAQIQLELDRVTPGPHKIFRAVISTAEGRQVWSQRLAAARSTASASALSLQLPARLLPEGDYEITLQGLAADGNFEVLPEYYYFSLARR